MSPVRTVFRWLSCLSVLSLVTLALTGKAGATQIHLTWVDNATSENGFKIERKLGTIGTFVQVATLEPDSTAYIDSGLMAETTYCYRLWAFNTAWDSPYSDEVCATTMAAVVDTDGDGLTDNDETNLYGTDPTRADTDGDGLSDGDEVNVHGTDPLLVDTDGDGFNDSVEISQGSNPLDPTSRPLPLEVGEVEVNHTWTRVEFSEPFLDPVVIANPLSLNGLDPAVVRIRGVGPTGFEIRLQEWTYLDGEHPPETVGYVVMERGSYVLADGTRVEAGRTNKTGAFGAVTFNQPFNTVPVVIATVSSFNEVDPVTGRLRNISINGFEFRVQEQESHAQTHATETVSYIAWEPSAGTLSGWAFEVDKTPNAVTQNFYPILFTEVFAESPTFLADMQTFNGGDTANLRWQNKDSFGVEVQIDEEQSRDIETYHVSEVVGYMLFAPKN